MGKLVEVEVMLAKKPRTLIFGMNAVADIEEHFGTQALAVIRDLGEAMQRDSLGGKMFSTLRACLWAGLRKRTPGIKLETVGDMMERDEMGGYLEACAKGLMEVYGIDKDKIREAQAKKEAAASAREKQSAGETLTADETKAIEEDDAADPLARSAAKDSQPSTSSGKPPSVSA
jgi:hypothetical protein